jgi:chromosomal replication initiation ATPase DnaA
LEDFDLFEDEELLLRLINCASEAKALLLLTAKNLPKVKIKDLASRLKNIVCAEIAEPSLDSMKQLLVSGLARRQIKLSNEALDFILLKIERSYAAIFAALKLIENAAAHEKLSAKKIREIFG